LFDYTPISNTALSLINKFGRSITLVDFNSSTNDQTKPWRGSSETRSSPDRVIELDAVFVEPSQASRLGLSTNVDDLLKRSIQIAMVATNQDLLGYQELLESDGTRWKIIKLETLRPADLTILYYIWVSK
jgi:hypothetical protein